MNNFVATPDRKIPGSSAVISGEDIIDKLVSLGLNETEIKSISSNSNIPLYHRKAIQHALNGDKPLLKSSNKPTNALLPSKNTLASTVKEVTQEELVNELNATNPDKSGMSTSSIKITDKNGNMLPEGIVRIENKYFKVKN